MDELLSEEGNERGENGRQYRPKLKIYFSDNAGSRVFTDDLA